MVLQKRGWFRGLGALNQQLHWHTLPAVLKALLRFEVQWFAEIHTLNSEEAG